MRHLVIGGGVAGVCCAEELCRLLPGDEVVLVSADKVLKGVSTVSRITKNIEELKVEEKQLDALPYPNLRMVQDVAAGIDLENKRLLLGRHPPLRYDKLCICAGARPKRLPSAGPSSSHVVYLRDTESLRDLCARLAGSRRVVVVGNGAIALEAVFALRGMEVVWALKHGHIGDALFDLDAAQFLLEEMRRAEGQGGGGAGAEGGDAGPLPGGQEGPLGEGPRGAALVGQLAPALAGRADAAAQQQPSQQHPQRGHESAWPLGHAVGPTWVAALPRGEGESRVVLEYGCQVESISPGGAGGQLGADDGSRRQQQQQQQQAQQQQQQQQAGLDTARGAQQPAQRGLEADGTGNAAASACSPSDGSGTGAGAAAGRPWNLRVRLSNGREYGADLVISAIGVTPALGWVPPEIGRGKDGGLLVDRCMETSQPGVYAAGDSCTACWPAEDSPHWFQMRLWTQARAMGVYAAHCMAGVHEQTGAGMAFELFTHATRFMGRKVVLLGLYNGQRLEQEPPGDVVTYCRVTEGPERTFVRVLLLRGRVQGAVLIGDTDLEETMENLILDQLDVSCYGPGLLDPEVELDHVFD